MIIPALIVYVFCIVILVIGVAAVFVGIPRHLRAMYRLELWELRDRYVDDLAAQRVAKSPAAIALMNIMEHSIAHAREFTLFNVLHTYFVIRSHSRNNKDDFFIPNTAPDRDVLCDYLQELTHIRVHWLYRTSPLGWLGPVVMRAGFVLWRLSQGLRPVVRDIPERDIVVSKRIENDIRPAMRLNALDLGDLAHCV